MPSRKSKPTQENIASADALLQSTGLRRTPVRIDILALLLSDPHPLSAQQVMKHLPPSTDSVTVYRTLATLTEKGLLHRIHGDDRVWRFAVQAPQKKAAHDHAHFVCDDCGTVECFNEVPVSRSLSANLKGAKGYDITYSEVLIHGTCPRCHAD